MVRINGKELDAAGMTVSQYLDGTDYDRRRIAIERNGQILPKAQYDETIL